MSEYTTVYLRDKNIPLLEYKEELSWEEIQNLSEDEIKIIKEERQEYNRKVEKSMGCELFYLTTTLSRELVILPWSPSPKRLTKEKIDEVISFYNEEIEDCKKAIANYKESIVRLETRIVKANFELYDKINEDIDERNENLKFWEEELERYLYLYNKFDFLKGIMEEDSNSKDYELIYTKS